MQKILIFGNAEIPYDNTPITLLEKLQDTFRNLEFIHCDPSEDIENHIDKNKHLIILDTVEGIERVTTITDLNQIKTLKPYSLHDFDLGHTLLLLKKFRIIEGAAIIGVPMNPQKETLEQIKQALESMVLQNFL